MNTTLTATEILERYGLQSATPVIEGNRVLFPVHHTDLAATMTTLLRTYGLRLLTVSAEDHRPLDRTFRVYYLVGVPKENLFLIPYLVIDQYSQTFPSLISVSPAFSLYEREIKSFFGLIPAGHPRAERIILHKNFPEIIFPLQKDAPSMPLPLPTEDTVTVVQGVEGEGVSEIPVGPVHAGIIEPGHFRFSVLGEEIVRFEAELGYVHKGVEKLFETLSLPQKLSLAERISGDSSVAHALTFAQAVESLADVMIPDRAKFLRVILLELERLANHMNDIGFIMLDTGLSFGGSHGARLRERVMQWNERLSGNRFLRGMIAFGGVSKDLSDELLRDLQGDLELLETDFREVMSAVSDLDSLLNRLRGTGTLPKDVALDYGAVGIAARASGIEMDTRVDFPFAGYEDLQFTVPIESAGDVEARFQVRIKEVHQSFRLLNQSLALLPFEKGSVQAEMPDVLPPRRHAVGVVEGWRGEIVHFVITDGSGKISRVKVRDPSFINWQLFPHMLTNDVVPDFPLINKSLNLSYSGNDL